jgi:hypothetical protein
VSATDLSASGEATLATVNAIDGNITNLTARDSSAEMFKSDDVDKITPDAGGSRGQFRIALEDGVLYLVACAAGGDWRRVELTTWTD